MGEMRSPRIDGGRATIEQCYQLVRSAVGRSDCSVGGSDLWESFLLAPLCSSPCNFSERRAQVNDHESIHAVGQSQTEPRSRARAAAKITVQRSEAKPYDQTASPALMEVLLSETFTGDIDGESTVRALQVRRDDRSASMVSVQRFCGKLGGRQGTFVLQGSEVIENGRITARWFVVPRSGTGDLSGLRGEGGFEGDFGKGSDGTLDYWFETGIDAGI